MYACVCVRVRVLVCVQRWQDTKDARIYTTTQTNMSEGGVVVVDLDLAQQALFECVLVLFVLLVLLFFSFSLFLLK